MSMFNPEAFLDATTTEVNEKRPALPTENVASPDGYYTAIIGDIPPPTSGLFKQGDRAGQPWAQVAVPLKIEVPMQMREALGLPAMVTVTDRVFIDLTPAGAIDNAKGRNNGQRVYREATGLNKPGEAFSWRMLTGRPVKVKIKHELYNETIQERVGGVFSA